MRCSPSSLAVSRTRSQASLQILRQILVSAARSWSSSRAPRLPRPTACSGSTRVPACPHCQSGFPVFPVVAHTCAAHVMTIRAIDWQARLPVYHRLHFCNPIVRLAMPVPYHAHALRDLRCAAAGCVPYTGLRFSYRWRTSIRLLSSTPRRTACLRRLPPVTCRSALPSPIMVAWSYVVIHNSDTLFVYLFCDDDHGDDHCSWQCPLHDCRVV